MSVRGYNQGVLSFKATETKLRETQEDLSYLTRVRHEEGKVYFDLVVQRWFSQALHCPKSISEEQL